MDGEIIAPNITVPEQKLTCLSFCQANSKQLDVWVRDLPMANIGETAKRLYHAIIEINQLIVTPSIRFQLMETIRGPIYYVCNELSKHFLNHSVVLPEKQKKIANLAQALQLHLANGYKLVIHDYFAKGSSEKTIRQLTPACHRAISDLSRCVVRASQLYCQSPPNVWLEIHQLHLFAHHNQLDNQEVKDEQLSFLEQNTIQDVYKRILLLGCCKPNQMRQKDIALVFDAFECWAKFTEIELQQDSAGLFLIDPDADAPPHYRALQLGKVKGNAIGFNTNSLMDKLTHYIGSTLKHNPPPRDALEMPVRLADNVLASLSQALGILTKRTFKRISCSGNAFVAVGLSTSHYFVSNGVEFNSQLADPNKDDPNSASYYLNKHKRADIWSSSFDSSPSEPTADMGPISFTGSSGSASTTKKRYHQNTVPLVNTSPGGYCVQWHGAVPGNVQAGELLAIREEESQPWSIGVIRWIRQMKHTGTQFGIELLAPNAKPCGVQLTQRSGESSEFLRGLLLPELTAIGQPTTLITPRLPFQVNHKVKLNKGGRETKVQLTRRVSATGSFSQFEIKFLNPTMLQVEKEIRQGGPSEDEFDSLWPTL
jgi:cyclic-di-GMP-binding protein